LYLTEGGYREGAIGTIISMFPLATAILALPSGFLSDRIGRKWCFLLGCCLFSTFMFVRALTLNYIILVAATFVIGIGGALLYTSHAPFLSETSGTRERPHLFSVAFANSVGAMMLGGVVGGWLPSVLRPIFSDSSAVGLLTYRSVLVIGALVTLISLLPLYLIKEEEGEEASRADETTLRISGASSVARRFFLNSLLIGVGAGLIVPFFNLYFYRRFECSSSEIGLFIAVAHGMMAVAVLTGPILGGRFGKLKAIVVIQLSSLPFLIMLGMSRSLPVSLISYWGRAALMNTAGPMTSNLMMDLLHERRRAAVNSVAITGGQLGRASATMLGGWLIQKRGYSAPFFITAILYALSSIIFFAMFRGSEGKKNAK
jgi:MFS family permease